MNLKLILNDNSNINLSLMPNLHLHSDIGEQLLDINCVAQSIFLLEDALRYNAVKEAILPVYGNYSNELNQLLENLIFFLFRKNVKVSFVKNTQTHLTSMQDNMNAGYTCLFSGGLDSYSGILSSKQHYSDVTGVYISHADQRPYNKLIHKLEDHVLSKYDIRNYIINSFDNKNYTRLSRGFLYILTSLLIRNRNVIISEIGPTMYQPKFTLLDDVTFTTHPRVLYFAKRVAESILETNIKLYKPYENLTKAEASSIAPDKLGIKITCSCRTTRFCNSKTPNEGSCYGCIIRKLSLLVAGIEDCQYKTNVFERQENGQTFYGNILPLLNFSVDFLMNPDKISRYSTQLITEYKKEDVFRRSAMDMLAGLLILKKTRKLKDLILNKFLDNTLIIIRKEDLVDRIKEVRGSKFKPDFKNYA